MFFSLMLTMMFLSLMFLLVNHPLSFGLILLIQTILTSFITGKLNYNYWFSYILFLIMVGGMLILFIYMTSIASNEKFKFSMKISIMFTSFFLVSWLPTLLNNFISMKISSMMFLNQSKMLMMNLSMNKFMNFPSNLIILMIMTYLLITLIAIVKITEINYGPIRQKN
uniref:NADH-ubiquinone oxidoreductase chain 6 n=1 Tax=Deporaus betulae TaxID=298190 RepID=J9PGX6_DEPBE|nr:NADH dehydrogenase subunit 6 [Deporaus betulae]